MESIAEIMIPSAKAMGEHSDDDGKYTWNQAFRMESIAKTKGAREHALQMNAKVGDILQQVIKKGMKK